jgi:hypothetical protein
METTTNSCACGATFATAAQLNQHALTCNVSREPGGDPTTPG